MFNAERIALVNAVWIMSISSSVPEIFALKLVVKVVVKRTKFCTFFALPNFKGAVPINFVPALTPQPREASSAKVSSSYTP